MEPEKLAELTAAIVQALEETRARANLALALLDEGSSTSTQRRAEIELEQFEIARAEIQAVLPGWLTKWQFGLDDTNA